MKKTKTGLPRAVLKSFVDDIKDNVGTNEGRMLILEMMEDIPYEIRSNLAQGLSTFYEPELVDFFYLLKLEFGKEFEPCCNRVLEKYSMAGIDISPPQIFQGVFHGAYASMTRQTGRIAVDIAWDAGDGCVQVDCIYLTFNADGIHSFFLIESMKKKQFEADRIFLKDMVALSFEEVCVLVSKAYDFNIRYMSKPASGKFLYQKYLDQAVKFSRDENWRLIHKLSARLTPRQLVNSLFHALKNQDSDYLSALLPANMVLGKSTILGQGAMLVEGGVISADGTYTQVQLQAYSLTLEERQLYRNEYEFGMSRDDSGNWNIEYGKNTAGEAINLSTAANPFNRDVFCRVYEIIDLDMLFDIIDKLEDIREVKELPYGMHMRINSKEDDLNNPVSFMSGVVADLVINGDEFVVMSSSYDSILNFDSLLTGGINYPTVKLGEYEVNILTAFRYMGGQYARFEDILLQEDGDSVFEDGMRCLSTRYLLKDRERVLEQIESLDNIAYRVSDDYDVFYQLEGTRGDGRFLAEYMVGSNWIILSTFGDRDMNRARKYFETKIYDYLEFDGLEVRNEGIFDVLTLEVKKEYPDLEPFLKDIYLNKWYHSHLTTLHGMSPSEACQTEDGTRLLWSMFKKIREKNKKTNPQGKAGNIRLKEYVQKLEQKKRKNV